MPSFKELAKSAHRTLCRCLATIILSFCGIASFSVIGITTLSLPASAVDTAEKSIDINLTLGSTISVRILDSTATSDLSLLSFDLTPTAAGVTSTKRAIVDVSTSNITGYKLYVEANGKDHNNQYTTDLVQGDTADSHVIPTSTTTTSNKNFWNYTNPLTSAATVVPAHGTPDKIGELMEPTYSAKSNVDINVGVDTTITSGAYNNQLLFTAIANAASVGYTLSFDLNGGSEQTPGDYATRNVTAAATSYTFTLPNDPPVKAGYAFDGFIDENAAPGEKGSAADPYLAGENVTIYAESLSPSSSTLSGSLELVASWTIINSTLTVDPNGGTWSGSTSTQTFPGVYGDTKVVANPSASYAISYNDNSQDATYSPNPPSPTSIGRTFTGWALTATGGGSPSGSFDTSTSTYTYNIADDTLTAGYNTTSDTFTLPQVTKTGYTCTWHENSASGTSHASGETNVTISADTEFYAVCSINQYTLTVDPNGGTWGGSTSPQNFSQDYGTTKTISNPTAGAAYTISYDMSGTAGTTNSTTSSTVPAPSSPTSVQRAFTSWSLSGAGSFAGNTYTYEAGNGTLTASYNSTSNTFTLPSFSKSGYTCTWNTKSDGTGTSYAPGATGVTITGNTTFYGICHSQFWTISNMQEMTSAICSSVYTPSNATGSSVNLISTESGYKNVTSSGTPNVAQRTLRDVRDSKNYTIRKLADGNCWMTQGLKYSLSAGVAATGSYTTGGTFSFTPTSCTTGGQCIMNGNTVMNTQNRDGYYYNYYAATAGTNMDVSGVDATGSICPNGWRLPGIVMLPGSTAERSFYNLVTRDYGAETNPSVISQTPLNFVITAYYGGGTFQSSDSRGFYWEAPAYFLLFSSSTVYSQWADSSFYPAGLNVRCVAI